MFAVPGWSVSSDALKAESAAPGSGGAAGATKSRKRKRAGAGNSAKEEPVTSDNLAELWESVVEGKKPAGPKAGQEGKRQKKRSAAAGAKEDGAGEVKSETQQGGDDAKSTGKDATSELNDRGNKEKKDKKKQKKEKAPKTEDKQMPESKPDNSAAEKVQSLLPQPPAPAKLTPLQASMREKLVSARFRHLNETLYTRPSEEAYQLFQDSPEMFGEYHEGFRRQVKVWPENPVDSFLQDIRSRAKIRQPSKGRAPGVAPPPISKTALPRTTGTCTIADLGCGDARLAESLQKEKKKLHIDVKSYDLQSPSPLVTKADIANLPLPDGSVNVAIFCLALMGTNWLDFIEEAYRILHWKGELWVAEIKSRFGPVRNKNAPVDHSVGNRRKQPTKKDLKAQEEKAAGLYEKDLAVEVDGMDDRRRETNVTAFVEVLRSRGFVLQGEGREVIDLSNKMFVKMHFIKGASPTKGKDAKPQEAPVIKGKKGFGQNRLSDMPDEKAGVDEAAILKPCVYKIR